jgi:hypothetical protein
MAYTTIDDPSAYFQTALYTGNDSSNAITNDGNSDLQPDWLWTKNRSSSADHKIFDSTRGVTKFLESNSTDSEGTQANLLSSFNSDGFTLGAGGETNSSSTNYVAWQWKANGGTTTTNDASSTGVGNTDSVYQANTTAGFSIVTWTGPSGSDARTMAHGLGGTPELIIYKNRDESVAWYVGTSAITFNFNTDYLQLNSDIAKATDAGGTVFVSAPTSTVIGSSSSAASGKENIKYVAYCFRSIQGYSKIGSYTGNGNANGPFVYLGFKPAWVMVKRTNTTGAWEIYDSARNGNDSNPINDRLRANDNAAENTDDTSDYVSDFLSNGWKIRTNSGNWNTSGHTYIYMAFAESPFVSSEGVPTTAR